jgi:hypothetical protein
VPGTTASPVVKPAIVDHGEDRGVCANSESLGHEANFKNCAKLCDGLQILALELFHSRTYCWYFDYVGLLSSFFFFLTMLLMFCVLFGVISHNSLSARSCQMMS